MPHLDFDPVKDVPALTGKVIVVTGGTAGLGYETVLSFAGHDPAHILFTGRSQPSADRLINAVKEKHRHVLVTFVQCDLASLDSVQKAAEEITAKIDRLDILMPNAGIMALPPGQTKEGYEIQFGTNHVGHALLVKLLTPILEATSEKTGEARIVWTTSLGYGIHPAGGIIFDKVKTTQDDISSIGFMGQWIRYGQSKLANLLYARAFARHHPSITSISIHPGVSATGLVTSLSLASRMLIYVTNIGKMVPPEECAWNQQWAATAPLGNGKWQVESGTYYEPIGVKGQLQKESGNDELAEQLWDWTQKELEVYTL